MLRFGLLTRIVTRQLMSQKVTSQILMNPMNFQVRKVSNEIDKKQLEKLIAAQDPDTFGTLSSNNDTVDDILEEEGDIKEEEFTKNIPSRSQKLSTKQYADMIKDHFKNRRVKEAIDVLEVRMLKEDRVKPENYIYNLLIDGCAREGYSKKAFNLFTRMRQRALKVTGATYTSLFNACANSPWKNDGLNKAIRLREIMLEKGYIPNETNYHAMIKAFGRCNDIKTAFLLVDEMADKQIPMKTETFNFLLQACASDREYGFRHALIIWHKMYQRRLYPDIFSFNLLLRCCRDCQLGDIETTEQVIQSILLRNPDTKSDQMLLEHNQEDKSSSIQIRNNNNNDSIPNLIAWKPHLGNMVSLSEVKNPEDRLLLIGGYSGFLEVMKEFGAKPTLHTFTELLEVIPPTTAAERRLLKEVKKNEVKCDVDFFNVLMKKRCMRYDYENAREVLGMIQAVKLSPDIVTYGVLALTCQTHEEAQALMAEMDSKGIKMNIEILGAMFKTACIKKNFDYAIEVLRIVRDLKIKPSDKLLHTLEETIKVCNRHAKRDFKDASRDFRENWKKFKIKVHRWKVDMGIDQLDPEEAQKVVKDKPWEQFQQPQAEGYEHTKGFKARNKQKYKRFIGLIKDKQNQENPVES